MTTSPGTEIYLRPAFYDALFPRDYAEECNFLEACLKEHGLTQERSFLELCCGPARNARVLSKRGYQVIGLDLERAMLSFAAEKAQEEGVTVDLVEGNMIDFDLPKPVSMIACLWDSILVILSNDDMLRHLRAVARNLLPGGIYVIETSHPRTYLKPYEGTPYICQVEDKTLELTWGLPDDEYDSILQYYKTTLRAVIKQGGREIDRWESVLPQRYFFLQEMRALIQLSGVFSEIHYYGKTSLPLYPLTNAEECDGSITVLVKGKTT